MVGAIPHHPQLFLLLLVQGPTSPCKRIPVNPMMEFSGVRNSWDMVARESGFQAVRRLRPLLGLRKARPSAYGPGHRGAPDTWRVRLLLFLFRDVGADAQDFLDLPPFIPDDLVRPGDPDEFAVAAPVLVDILLEGQRVLAELVDE